MDLSDLLTLDAILPNLKASSKKLALQELSARAAEITRIPERDILDTLVQRERQGSTGVGHGIAIPHSKMAPLNKLVGVFARLDRPIDFEAVDDEPVDLLFLLLAPQGAGADHLKALARIARVLRDPGIAGKLRATPEAAAIYAVLTEPSPPSGAPM